MSFYEKRIAKLQKLLKQLDLQGMIITNGSNMRYLTGFTGGTGDGVLVVSLADAAFMTDARYENEYVDAMPEGVSLNVTRAYYQVAVEKVVAFGIKKLGFEADMPYADYQLLDDLLPADIAFDAVPGAVEALREIKDEAEAEALRKAATASTKAFNDLMKEIKVGMTEREVANRLDALQKQYGADKPSFDTIVASGARSAMAHGTATDKKLEKGDLVTIDFGYFVDGYTSDVTRTIAMGEIDPELKKVYEVVKQANEDTIDVIKPGLSTEEVDRVARDYIDGEGYGEDFNHATGHGAGLDIHEGPILSARSSDEVQAGNLLTVEPGVYLAGKGGVRIEDDVLVTENGHEVLTAGIPKDLLTIDR
ncbi:aminopeptidase P family protein [Fructobacillus parabroussonetiae]|uniref:Aminopeptidase P family protein n=1 Tax=Fructobacillus parabroussonetiae TaxID=2713174 RepID=A0ABS5QWC5_9LACO|nr:aminopeptidase P family protein [Fructobacillus parabroussonetiae]MBS9337421.1 aminopeptidase P family protein [Fructobacillus parabroussonetiae]